jgi:hypothetical protein
MNPRSLKHYLKFLPLVAVFAFGVVLISLPKDTEATPLGAPSLSLTVVPINGTTVVTAMYTDDTPAGSGSAVLTASPVIGTFLAGATVSPAAGDGTEAVSVSGATVTVTEDLDTLATAKTIVATFQCTQAGVTAFTIAHGGTTSAASVSLICGDYYGQYPGYPGGFPGYYPQYPQYPTTGYPTYTTATNLTVSASPASTVCTSPSTISIAVKDASGNFALDGTSVTVSASTGTVSPNVVSTSGGTATTTFTAPNNTNGTATVTATSGQGTGYATVSFTCTSASTPVAPVYPPAAYPPSYSPILPPNTGDAGLAGTTSGTTYAGIAVILLSVLGMGASAYTLRRRSVER